MTSRIKNCWDHRHYCRLCLEVLGEYIVPLRWFLGWPLHTATLIDVWCYGRIYPRLQRRESQHHPGHRLATLFWMGMSIQRCANCHDVRIDRADLWNWEMCKHKYKNSAVTR